MRRIRRDTRFEEHRHEGGGTVCRGASTNCKNRAESTLPAGVPLPTLMLELEHESLAVIHAIASDPKASPSRLNCVSKLPACYSWRIVRKVGAVNAHENCF